MIFLPILIIIALSLLEGSVSSMFANIAILLIGMLYCLRFDKKKRHNTIKFFSIVFSVYTTFSYIASLSFLNGAEFYLSDASGYLSETLNNYDYRFGFDELALFYIRSEGKDVLYHVILHMYSGIGNSFLGSITVYYMTLLQTLFGVLSCLTFYLILDKRYERRAYTYAIVFSCCSILLAYSCFVVRDIIITYFYIEALRIVLEKYKSSNLFLLIILIVLAAGIRFFSGVFLVSFLLVYLYLLSERTKYRTITTGLFVFLTIVVLGFVLSSVFFDTSIEEINVKQENMEERIEESGGLINNLIGLPPGLRQVAVLLFSQIAPFPPYGTLIRAEKFCHYFIGIDVVVFEVFWYFVFYTLLSALLFKKFLKRLSKDEIILLILSLIFILALTAHPDIRRMMPVYPILYMLYLKVKESYTKQWFKNTRIFLMCSYVLLLCVYLALKGV